MKRIDEIRDFNEIEYKEGFFVEPEERLELLWERIQDVIATYEPKTVVKAGLGRGEIVKKITKNYKDIVLVVVEPSLKLIEQFISENSDDADIKNIRFIAGEFKKFPVDYYAADLVISVDNINIVESAPVIDEFKRALEFEAHLFISGVVLDDDDEEGVYDEYMKKILPIHNDYYLHEDLKTFLNLKEFAFIKGKAELIDLNLKKQSDHIASHYEVNDKEASAVIEGARDTFENIYSYDGEKIKLPYFTGVFMRKKIKPNAQI